MFLLLGVSPARARTTAAEAAAQTYADRETTAAPTHGNLPDYSLPPASLAKAHHLATISQTTFFTDEIWGILQLVLLLFAGGIALFRDRAVRLSRNRWLQGFAFAFLLLLAETALNLPLGLYLHHISRRYGFSVQGWGSWLADQAKMFALEWLVGGLLLMLLFLVIRKSPRRWWFIFWLCSLPITLFGAFVQPYVEPLFFHYQPLAKSHPELVERLEQVVHKGHMEIPPDRMFLMQASAKLTVPNADVEGFGHSKRVVVWDTALQKLTPDQIVMVFGHESGHYVLGHVTRGILLSFAGSLLLFYLGFHLLRWALARFGPRWRIPNQDDWGSVAVLLLAFAVMNTVSGPVAAAISRQQEHAADIYGQEAVHGLVADPQRTAQTAFDALGATTFDDPNPPGWYRRLTFSHPPIGWRAAFARAYDPWAPGMVPKYFPPTSSR